MAPIIPRQSAQDRPSTPRFSRRLAGKLALAALMAAALCSRLSAQALPAPTAGLQGDPAWREIGGFAGARSPEAADLLSNEIFRESRNGELFQDLGDLQFELGHTWDTVGFDLKANFKRRVVERHAELPPEATIGPNQLSRFQTINEALAKAELNVDYLKDRLDPFWVGLQSSAGFALTIASTEKPIALTERSSRRLHVGTPAEELRAYWNSHHIDFDRRILRDTGRALVDFIGLLAGQVGGRLEDTEEGAVFFEGFVEPLTVWADLGVPLKPELFREDNPELEPGDAVTYQVFIEVSPLSVGMDQWGAQVNMKGFSRFLRETTVAKRANDVVLVRVKNIAARGLETTPLKIRPELKWLFLRYGYTFLSDRFDNSWFRASELTYRIDLKNPVAAAAFAQLLGSGHRIQFKPLVQAAKASDGVQILSSMYRNGDRRQHAFMARFPSWFRADHRTISVVQEIQSLRDHYQEATRATSQNFRQNWWRHRQRSQRAVLTLQSAPLPAGTETPDNSAPANLLVSLQIQDHEADPDKVQHMADLLRGILGVDVRVPERTAADSKDTPPREGASFFLNISAGRQALDRLREADDELVWRALAEFYLGPQLQDTWATDELRRPWRQRHSARRNAAPAPPQVSKQLDIWLRHHPDVPRGIGIAVDQRTVPTAELFERAAGFVRRLHRLRAKASFGSLCSSCWRALYSDARDIAFLQLLLVRVAGSEELGYSGEIFTDGMFRPLRVANGLAFDNSRLTSAAPSPVNPLAMQPASGATPSVSEIGLPSSDARGNVPDIDSIDSSNTRLRAGHVFREAATGRLRLELYSDYRFAEGLRLRAELRHSRIRADLAMGVRMFDLPSAVPVAESPFMIAKYRYDIDLPWELSRPKKAYALYLRVINSGGLPVTEEAALRFRTPAPPHSAR